MSTTTYNGAVYGLAVYGADVYGQHGIVYVPDGVSSSVTSDSGVIIIGDSNSVVIGVVSSAIVSSVGIIGNARFVVSGISSVAYVDSLTTYASAVLLPSGVSATINSGSVTVTNTSFTYVANNYDRALTVYVDAYPNRTVYVEPKPTENNRRMLVAETWS